MIPKSAPGRRLNRFKNKTHGRVKSTDKYKVYTMLVPAWNRYDGFMLGALFHNISIPHRRFYFIGTPLILFQLNPFEAKDDCMGNPIAKWLGIKS
jgi:hypothetical protein